MLYCFGKKFLAIFLTIVFFICFPVTVFSDDSVASGSFNVARTEQEYKISLPLDRIEEVRNFIDDFYIKDKHNLKDIDPSLAASTDVEEFDDIYFDTPDLKFLDRQGGIRHRKRINLSDLNDEKSGRELVQIKTSGISSNPIDRQELKFPVELVSKKDSPTDFHPLLGLVKGNYRKQLEERIIATGVEPTSLKPIFSISDYRNRIYITKNGEAFITISLDDVSSEFMKKKVEFAEIELELNEITYTSSDDAGRKYMEEINSKIHADLLQHLPFLKDDLTPKYNKTFNQFEAQIKGLRFLIMTNLTYTSLLFTTIVLAIVVILVLWFIFRKTSRSKIPERF